MPYINVAGRRNGFERKLESLGQAKVEDRNAKANASSPIEHRGEECVDVDLFGVKRMGRKTESHFRKNVIVDSPDFLLSSGVGMESGEDLEGHEIDMGLIALDVGSGAVAEFRYKQASSQINLVQGKGEHFGESPNGTSFEFPVCERP